MLYQVLGACFVGALPTIFFEEGDLTLAGSRQAP